MYKRQDFNSALHYAVYFSDDDMISYLVRESRRFERLENIVLAKNVYNLCPRRYAVHDDLIKRHLDRLEEEVEEMIERQKLMPNLKRIVSTLWGNVNFFSVALAVFGWAIGRIVCKQGGS